METVKKKEEGYRFDAELDGRVNNPAAFTHNKFLDFPFNKEIKEQVRPTDSRPPAIAERIARDFKLSDRLLADAIDTLKKEYKTFSGDEADFFKQVTDGLKDIRRKELGGKELVSDRLELMPKEERAFWAKGDQTIVADPVEFSRQVFYQMTRTFIKGVEKTPEGKEEIVERPWVARDSLPGWTAEKIAEQYKGEKLLKVAELLEKTAAESTDKAERVYFEEVARDLRLAYHDY